MSHKYTENEGFAREIGKNRLRGLKMVDKVEEVEIIEGVIRGSL